MKRAWWATWPLRHPRQYLAARRYDRTLGWTPTRPTPPENVNAEARIVWGGE